MHDFQNEQLPRPGSRPLVSIIIPARNEEANIPRLEQELREVLDGLAYDFEFILVDNHSEDSTGVLARELCQRDPRWRYIRFSRNFTVEMSMTAGYQAARGDAVVVLYSDLQDPPSLIPAFLTQWELGFDVVFGVRTERPGDARWRNLAVRLTYRLIGWMSDVPIPVDAGDFRLVSRRVRDVLVQLPEQNRYMRGLIAWLGFRQIGVPYARRPRLAGRSNAPLGALVNFTLDAVSSFSLKPLRLFTVFGLVSIVAASVAVLIYLAIFILGSPPSGITTIVMLLWITFGFNMLGIGMLGEYLGRTYTEVKRRPLFVVEEAVNVDIRLLVPYDPAYASARLPAESITSPPPR